ncbi:hypothetical protein [Aneurinibacillus sp. REN35]|uniref:hypothetical protein n=1 Tax=Aneurinibacillus sp. REN35 TaxID=3237286 RepID=UPI0035278B7E
MQEEVYELKRTLRELINNLVTRIEEIVELYGKEENEANKRMIFLTEDLASLTDGVHSLSSYEDVELNIGELTEKVQLIVEKLEIQEYSFVSDLLNYELKPLLEHWSDILWIKN